MSHDKTTPENSADQWSGDLAQLLQLDRLGADRFLSRYSQPNRKRGLFGGQLLGQGLVAAAHTVAADRIPSHLSINFLLAGDRNLPIVFEVESLLEGGSFSVRRVRAEQGDKLIADLSASFQKPEAGFEHQDEGPSGVPPPEGLLNFQGFAEKYRERLPTETYAYLATERPVDLRPVDIESYFLHMAPKPENWYWMKAVQPLGSALLAHYSALAYMSDWWFNPAGITKHVDAVIGPGVFATSLNHSIWFQRPFAADDWLLFCSQSPTAFGAHTVCFGRVWDRRGQLIATIAQEALARKRRPPTT